MLKMNYLSKLILLLVLFSVHHVFGQKKNEVFLFSYFTGNGEDGLHLAYSIDGYTWETLKNNQSFLKPATGKDKLMRDPCIIKGRDGKYHMVWTVSWNEKGIGYASSADLIKWSEQKYIPVMEHETNARNCWAPEIYYDKKSDVYLIFWSTTISGKFPESETEADNKYNHRMYCVTTRDFLNFSETKLFYNQGFNVIDGTLLRHKGEYVLFLKDETKIPPQKNIRKATSKHLISGYSKPTEPITGKYWAEGPTVLKKGKEWIVYFDKYTDHKMGAIRSFDLKKWEDISELVVFPKGTRHGTVFKVPLSILSELKKQ